MNRRFAFLGVLAVILLLVAGCSQSIEEKLSQVRKDLASGNYEKAQKKVASIVEVDSTTAEAIYGQGLLNEYRGLDWDALIAYIEVSPMNDGFMPAMESFMDLAVKLDYLDNAAKMAILYAKRRPESPRPYLILAEVALRQNKLDSAKIFVEQAAEVAEDDLVITLMKAKIDIRTYDDEIITSALQRLSDTEFTTADHFARLAEIYDYLFLGDSAIQYAQMAVDRDDNVYNRLLLAEYLTDYRHLYDADKVTRALMKDAPEFGPAQMTAAKITWLLGHEAMGDQEFLLYMQANQGTPVVLEQHGDFYAGVGDKKQSAIEWQAAYVLADNLKYPDDYIRQLYLRMMNGFLDERNIPDGYDYFQEGKSLFTESLEMYFIEAELKSYFDDAIDSAMIMVDKQVHRHRDDPKWMAYAARYFFRRGKFDTARELYTGLLDVPYPQESFYLNLLHIYGIDDDLEAADQLAAGLPYRYKNSSQILTAFRDFYRGAEQFGKALEYADRLHKMSPDYLPHIHAYADLLLALDRVSDARDLYVEFLEIHPDIAEAHYNLARFDFDNGTGDDVLGFINQTLAIDTGYAYAFELKGEYFQANNQMDSALYYYEKTIAMNWPTPIAYHNVAEYYLNKFDSLGRAAGLAMAAIRFFDNDRRGYLLLGKIYFADGKTKLAQQQFSKGAKIFPDDAEYQFWLGKAYYELKDTAKAKESLNKALKLQLPSPQKEEAQGILGKL